MRCDFKLTGQVNRKGIPEHRCTRKGCAKVTYTKADSSRIHAECNHPTIFALGDFISLLVRICTLGHTAEDKVPISWLRTYSRYFYAMTWLISLGLHPIWLDPEKGCHCAKRRERLNRKFFIRVPNYFIKKCKSVTKPNTSQKAIDNLPALPLLSPIARAEESVSQES